VCDCGVATGRQRCAWTRFGIVWFRTPTTSNGIRSEFFFTAAGAGLDLDFVFAVKTILVVCMICTVFTRSQARAHCLCNVGAGAVFGLKICKLVLVPDLNKSESAHL